MTFRPVCLGMGVRESVGGGGARFDGAHVGYRLDTFTLFCNPSRMKKLSIHIALIIALGPSLIATEADGSFNMAPLRGVAFDFIPVCSLPKGVVSYYDPKDMPAALRDAIKQKLGELVPPDSPFDATDVVMTGHNRRLIFIWVRGNRWVVATEHGGRGYNDPIIGYDVSSDGKHATLVAERTAYPNSVCLTAEELLNQRAAATPVGIK